MSRDISGNGVWFDDPVEKVPMHPEDFSALLAWVRAREYFERSRE
jgi:hypothetical protein